MVRTSHLCPKAGLRRSVHRTLPGCTCLLQALVLLLGSTALLALSARAQTHFSGCLDGTGNVSNATVVVPQASTPAVDGTPLAPGSEIAVFSEVDPGRCVGVVTWNGENTVLTVWGDDPDTATVQEGLAAGERMHFRVWDASTGTEYGGEEVTVSFAAGPGRNASGQYQNDAFYVLAALGVTTDAPGGGQAIGEAGSVTVAQADASQWHTVILSRSYNAPVVIMQPPSFNDAAPVTVRVRNVTANRFEFQLDEWDYLDGVHGSETIGYLVVEAGVHTLDDGRLLQAGTTTARTKPVTTVYYHQPMTGTPVVLSQVVTVNEAKAVVTRQKNISSSRFTVYLQSQESAPNHGVETVAWVALAVGAGTTGGSRYEATVTADVVTHAWRALTFSQSFANVPVLLAAMQRVDSSEPASVRYNGLSATEVSVKIEEEQSKDSEVRHTTETVGYLLFENGPIVTASAPGTPQTRVEPSGDGEALQAALEADTPDEAMLEGNYPNPFNPVTTIRYRIPADEYVTLEVYNVVGQRVALLVHERQPAGVHAVQFDAHSLPSGLYLYRIQAGRFVEQRKMMLVK